ncbi:hypothetical protein CEXT_728701 [Caerostris extrusa]|uniref:Uncharacterized protein n=1 Tax=Caerostris extrusa TaxID=172846 RepID=A0AAV4Y8H8_CAEEX|nr:hypothetical protein CEXT_728701 [Caerostris extrusa]
MCSSLPKAPMPTEPKIPGSSQCLWGAQIPPERTREGANERLGVLWVAGGNGSPQTTQNVRGKRIVCLPCLWRRRKLKSGVQKGVAQEEGAPFTEKAQVIRERERSELLIFVIGRPGGEESGAERIPFGIFGTGSWNPICKTKINSTCPTLIALRMIETSHSMSRPPDGTAIFIKNLLPYHHIPIPLYSTLEQPLSP